MWHDRSETAGARPHDWRVGRDGHLFVDVADRNQQIDLSLLAGRDVNAVPPQRLESLQMDLYAVLPWRKARSGVGAFGARRADQLPAGGDLWILQGNTENASDLEGLPPTITATVGGITRVRATPASNSQIATVSDTSAGTLTVTATTVPAGITVSNIVNTNGNVTADVAAGCGAALGANTVVLTVTNGTTTQTATANLTVNVTAKLAVAV